jgi:diamine N-acetyltransferase
MEATIRKLRSDEVLDLQSISRQTFSETFAPSNTEEDLRKYLDEELSVDRLTAEVNNENSQFYFAEVNGELAGYLKINSGDAQTELKTSNAIEIERIYVLKKYQGQQVGQVLYLKAVKIAEEANADFLWLGVWEKNERAINFYKKNGFLEFDKHAFRLGDDVQTDIMMRKMLRAER